MVNFAKATTYDVFQDTLKPTAVGGVLRGRFVDHLGNGIAVSGARATGISVGFLTADEIVAKKTLPVGIAGGYPMETGGVYALGAELASDNQGRPRAAVPGDYVNGIAQEESTAAGQVKRVWIKTYKI